MKPAGVASLLLALCVGCLYGELQQDSQALATESCACTETNFLLPPSATTEPPSGLFTTSFMFNGVLNQTLVMGQNPINAGADADKPMLGIATELRYSPTPGTTFAEEYMVWEHDDGTQFRPIGFTGQYETKRVSIGFYGQTIFLSDDPTPIELFSVSRTGAVFSSGGPDAGFYAAGPDRLILAADQTAFINAPIVESVNGAELRLGGGNSWDQITCYSPWHFAGEVFADGGLNMPEPMFISSGTIQLIGANAGNAIVGSVSNPLTLRASFGQFFLVGGVYIMQATPSGVAIGKALYGPNTNAVLDVVSDTKGLLGPRMTTEQRDAVTWSAEDEGMEIYNLTIHKKQVWNGAVWETLVSS